MFTPEYSHTILSPFSPRNTSRRSAHGTPVSQGQSNQSLIKRTRLLQTRSSVPSRVLQETPLHRVETYGLPLPVQVNEIITTVNERSAPASVHFDASGWAWLVFERRLLVWKYKSTETSKVTFCKEFLLPQTELYHSAKLVCLVGSPGLDIKQYGVLVVSPEGVVSYWPSMVYESSPIETETELVGQEFHSLVEFQPLGYILSTTTNDILLLSIQKKTIHFHRFRSPGGMLSGFGRRMSSFIFGSDQSSSTRLHKVVVDTNIKEAHRIFYVLSGNNLCKWIVDGDKNCINERAEMNLNIGLLFEQQAVQKFQVSVGKVTSFCIDAQVCGTNVSVLCGVVVKSESDESYMYYFIGTISVDPDSEYFGRFVSFVQLRFAEIYQEELHQKLVDFNLVIPSSSRQAFVYNENIIVCSSVQNTEDILNKVQFQNEGDVLWGSGYSKSVPVFFSRKHGIVSINVTTELLPSIDESERQADGGEVEVVMSVQGNTIDNDDLTLLRTAFLQFCQGNKDQSVTMCEERFENLSRLEDSSVLDATVASISKEIIDDYPASDPRWAEAIPADSATASASLIIIHQLEDKLKAHDYFIQFLREATLFDKLKTTSVPGRLVCTRHLLCEYAEKLKFAVALRRQHNQYQELVDNSITLVLKEREENSTPKGLTQQDLFYREVSRISDIIKCLIDYEKYRLSQHKDDHQDVIIAVNTILESALHEAWQYRQGNATSYTPSDNEELNVEFVPWTASCGPEGTRTLLLEQLEITCEMGLSIAEDQKTRSVIIQQIVDLGDIILDGYLTQINSLRNLDDPSLLEESTEKFERDRHKVIYPLATRGYIEEALSLAEKYRDFGILVEICEENSDQDKLQQYMSLFSNQGFSDFAFKWYMDRGKRSKLMSQPTTQHENLSKFLSSHDHLKWLHDIERQSFFQAYETLEELAKKEEKYLARKKTLLSLGMLALLASDESEVEENIKKMEDINRQQVVITHQESIPAELLQNAGMDPMNQAPISPDQLIELYIGETNKHSDETDFKKALDILQIAYSTDMYHNEYETLRERIWCKAILRDEWSKLEGDDPLVAARDTIFFKTVQLAYHQGYDLTTCMPQLESFLVADDLKNAGLTENTTFQYLLRAGYEQILRTHDDTEME